jgi:taurine dioxygenase
MESRIDVRPVAGALGAEIFGADLARPLDDATFREIHDAFLDHVVIFFRDQHLTPEQYKAFARRFGELEVHRYLKGLDGHPEVLPIVREPGDREVFAAGWHSDVTYQERPVLGSMLYAREIPDYGADTLFANQYLAYEALSPGMRAMLDHLVGIHGTAKVYDPYAKMGLHDSLLKADRKSVQSTEEVEHPVVRKHPETKRKALFVNPHYTLRFKDMTEEESKPLLDFLFAHGIRPEFTCRFRWAENSIVFWDNRCTLHTPIDDYFGKRRIMHRITVKGDRPA